jgi:hypothetical protein
MQANVSRRFLVLGFLGAGSFASPAFLRAQAPAGPMPAAQPQPSSAPVAKPLPQQPEVQPRTSIFGTWKFNKDDSDDARKKMQEARGSDRRGGGGGGVRMGGGIPGMGGYGGHRRGGQENESDQQRQGMEELLSPAGSLTLAEAKKDTETDLFDDQDRKRAFFTDGRKLQKSKDDKYQEIAAHWDGARLVTDEKSPRGGKMSRSFELSPDGKQLFETLHMTTGRSNTPLIIRYVYNPAGPSKP